MDGTEGNSWVHGETGLLCKIYSALVIKQCCDLSQKIVLVGRGSAVVVVCTSGKKKVEGYGVGWFLVSICPCECPSYLLVSRGSPPGCLVPKLCRV